MENRSLAGDAAIHIMYEDADTFELTMYCIVDLWFCICRDDSNDIGEACHPKGCVLRVACSREEVKHEVKCGVDESS